MSDTTATHKQLGSLAITFFYQLSLQFLRWSYKGIGLPADGKARSAFNGSHQLMHRRSLMLRF